MLRLHLPPNLVAAAARDAVPIRVEVDLHAPPVAELFPALALLQRWCGSSTPPKLIQLSCAQLRELAAVVGAHPVFIEQGRATAWQHQALVAPPATLANPTRPPSTAGAASRLAPGVTPLEVDGSEHFLALTLPSREHPGYAAALALVKENGFILEPSNRKWWLRERHKVLNFLAAQGARLRENLGARFTPNFERNTLHIRAAEVTAEVEEAGDGFAVAVGLRAGNADEAALRAAVATSRGYIESAGRVFLFDPARLQ